MQEGDKSDIWAMVDKGAEYVFTTDASLSLPLTTRIQDSVSSRPASLVRHLPRVHPRGWWTAQYAARAWADSSKDAHREGILCS